MRRRKMEQGNEPPEIDLNRDVIVKGVAETHRAAEEHKEPEEHRADRIVVVASEAKAVVADNPLSSPAVSFPKASS